MLDWDEQQNFTEKSQFFCGYDEIWLNSASVKTAASLCPSERVQGLRKSGSGGLSTNELRGNTTNDLSASSALGVQGTVALNTLATDPSSGLVELPVDLTDRSNEITPGCGLGNDSSSEFIVSGRGGLPPQPGDPLADPVSVTWITSTDSTETTTATPPAAAPPPWWKRRAPSERPMARSTSSPMRPTFRLM